MSGDTPLPLPGDESGVSPVAKIDPYEKHADAYDDWYSRNRYAYESELMAIRRLLPKGGKGVEIGVGTGRFAAKLGIPIGVEPSRSMGKIARDRGIAVIRGIAEALPFRDGRFDIVLMVTTLCFFDDVEGAMREAYRVLSPAGSLVIGFIDRESPLGKEYEEHKSEHPFYRDATFRSAREVAAILKRAGFRTLSFCQTIFRDPNGMDGPDPVREGHGAGCFAVVRADK
jgi:SAM-dependent methyltransferase